MNMEQELTALVSEAESYYGDVDITMGMLVKYLHQIGGDCYDEANKCKDAAHIRELDRRIRRYESLSDWLERGRALYEASQIAKRQLSQIFGE